MWTRRELKTKAKMRLRFNYINMAAVAVIFMLVMNAETYYNNLTGNESQTSAVSSVSSLGNMTDSSSLSHYTGLFSGKKTKSDEYFNFDDEETIQESIAESAGASNGSVSTNQINNMEQTIMFGDVTYGEAMKMSREELLAAYWTYWKEQMRPENLKASLPFAGFWFFFMLLIGNAVEVGTCAFFVKNTGERVRMREVLTGFKLSYLRNVLALFIRDIKVSLWTLLFFFPGVIKSLEYRMVPYLLAEFPEMTRKEAFKISKELMMGEKWDTLILDFSFILWSILDLLTGGIAGILWVNPYQMATNAELYQKLKELKGYTA